MLFAKSRYCLPSTAKLTLASGATALLRNMPQKPIFLGMFDLVICASQTSKATRFCNGGMSLVNPADLLTLSRNSHPLSASNQNSQRLFDQCRPANRAYRG